jgi:hypothetical protein
MKMRVYRLCVEVEEQALTGKLFYNKKQLRDRIKRLRLPHIAVTKVELPMLLVREFGTDERVGL